jgi:hypothetical protein
MSARDFLKLGGQVRVGSQYLRLKGGVDDGTEVTVALRQLGLIGTILVRIQRETI